MSVIIPLIIILGIVIGAITFFLIRSIIAPQKISSIPNLLKQGKIGAATRTAKQILVKEPRDPDAHYFLGLAYLAENKHELALMELKTVNEIGHFGKFCPEIQFRNKIAELYARFNQPEEALKEYLLLIRLEPQQADHYFNAGSLFQERNKSDKAVNYFRKAIELSPMHHEAHYNLGYILYRAKRPVEAKVELETALKVQPNNYNAYFYLGRLLKESHDYVGALLSFEKAQRDPDLKIKSLVERGGCYMSMNNFDKAISELERAVRLSNNDAANDTLYARYFLAACYEKLRKIESAITNWEKIYAKKPSFRDVAEKLSQYQELRVDDRMKDYLTSSMEKFFDICKAITLSMNLAIRDITDVTNGCQIIAVETEQKWRAARKLPKIIRFLRVPELIDESTVRNLHEEMKKLNVTRGIILSSSNFSRKAIEYAESRPVDLLDKEKLQDFLKKTDSEDTSKVKRV